MRLRWMRVAIRVAGSWIAAMDLDLAFAKLKFLDLKRGALNCERRASGVRALAYQIKNTSRYSGMGT